MHAVTRTYTGTEVLDLITANAEEVEELLRGIEGFDSYLAIRTETGAVTITVYETAESCAESVTAAREWLTAQGYTGAPPVVAEGEVALDF